MKRITISMALILLLGAFNGQKASAQDNNLNVITTSLSNLIVVTPTLYYERVLGEKISGKMGAYYTLFKVEDTKMSGLGLMPEFRFYPGQKGAPRGFYLAPFAKYSNWSLSDSRTDPLGGASVDVDMTLSGFGGGLLLGIQAGNNFVFDIFMGPSFTSWDAKFEGTATADDFSLKVGDAEGGTSIGLRFGTSIGLGF